ncbi:MAG: S-layer protein, partial [Planctomycetaceae bacterium]|nr:S-layer protein [Planctomycetaceae bacterium]
MLHSRLVGLTVFGLCSWFLGVATSLAAERPVSFVNEVVPLLTKAGCNIGVCHAKAGNGQNGFQLSLLGFEPLEDYDHLVKEARGRRLFTAAPDQSLLLLKASGKRPHGGGVRLEETSAGYALLRQWIAQGALLDKADAPKLVSFAVQHEHGTIARGGQQQLKAIAKYSDGSERDITSMALYESNDRSMVAVDDRGLVKVQDLT